MENETIPVCKKCIQQMNKELAEEITQLLKNNKGTWECHIDTIGDTLIALYKCARDKEMKEYANRTIQCVMENTIKKE